MGAVITAVDIICAIGYCLLVARAIVPWLPLGRENAIIGRLNRATDPFLVPIRLGLPPDKIGFDFSPFAGIIVLWLLQGFIVHFILGG
jgi:uncharacterized protein YggT (Ycf19 family)